MKKYSSRSGKKSGVIAFEIGTDFITVQFDTFKSYTYSYQSAGIGVVERMKKLALDQKGLSTFVAQHHPGFDPE